MINGGNDNKKNKDTYICHKELKLSKTVSANIVRVYEKKIIF
jgi:hypothetical protein